MFSAMIHFSTRVRCNHVTVPWVRICDDYLVLEHGPLTQECVRRRRRRRPN